MTTKQKFQAVVAAMTTTLKPTFYVGSVQRLNHDLQQINTFPVILLIQPIAGRYKVDTQIKKQPNILLWFAFQSKTDLHRDGAEVNSDEDTAHIYVVEFIKRYNLSGHFEKVLEWDWSFAVDQTDKNLTFVALQFNSKEVAGTPTC